MSTTMTTTAPVAVKPSKAYVRNRLEDLFTQDPLLADRVERLRSFGRRVRNTEVHLTNACNIRCKGCWYFEYEFDGAVKELRDLDSIRSFVGRLKDDGVTSALLIGGEPTLAPKRIEPFVELMDFVTISTNGLRRLPQAGFEEVGIAVSLFGGGPLDDELRAIRPNGKTFTGLFESALDNYRDDPRVTFIYALAEPGIEHIRDTVRRIGENGNQVSFNFYSAYGSDDPLRIDEGKKLLDEALRMQQSYPEAVVNSPYYIETLITGRSHWGVFGYDVCPSLSFDNPVHAERLQNGNPVLPGFNVYAADFETIEFCCTSGHCSECRDSQAVYSWLLVSMRYFLDSPAQLWQWVETAESYWRQWYWAPYNSGNPDYIPPASPGAPGQTAEPTASDERSIT